jgi:hypothetical protein
MNEIELFLKECQDKTKNKKKLAFLDKFQVPMQSGLLYNLLSGNKRFIHIDLSAPEIFNCDCNCSDISISDLNDIFYKE